MAPKKGSGALTRAILIFRMIVVKSIRRTTMRQRGDSDFFSELRSKLYTAVLSDVLDELGLRNQAMRAGIRPLDDTLVLAGFARTGLFRDVYHVAPGHNPYELEIRIIDDLKPDEVVVFGC